MTRSKLQTAQTILVKIGTDVVNASDGFLAMGRVGSIIEQICRLHMRGKRVILVSSGAVGLGRIVLRRQAMLSGSIQAHITGRLDQSATPKACASAGQGGMQALYEALFSQYDVVCSQILASDADFHVPESRDNLCRTIRELLDIGIIPIVNENDVTSQRQVPLTDDQNRVAWDNDSLASLVASGAAVDLLINVTDSAGFFHANEDTEEKMIEEYDGTETKVKLGKGSRVGVMGQEEKLNAVLWAIKHGVKYAVVADMNEPNGVLKIVDGEAIGTLFCARKLPSRL